MPDTLHCLTLPMTDESFTGLHNPYGAYKRFVSLLYLSGLVILKGGQEPYVDRAARRVRRTGLNLMSYTKMDIAMKSDQKRLLEDLRAGARYLKQIQALEHALPGFKVTCAAAERETFALIQSLEGGWSERMFPMLESSNDR